MIKAHVLVRDSPRNSLWNWFCSLKTQRLDEVTTLTHTDTHTWTHNLNRKCVVSGGDSKTTRMFHCAVGCFVFLFGSCTEVVPFEWFENPVVFLKKSSCCQHLEFYSSVSDAGCWCSTYPLNLNLCAQTFFMSVLFLEDEQYENFPVNNSWRE